MTHIDHEHEQGFTILELVVVVVIVVILVALLVYASHQ